VWQGSQLDLHLKIDRRSGEFINHGKGIGNGFLKAFLFGDVRCCRYIPVKWGTCGYFRKFNFTEFLFISSASEKEGKNFR